MNTLGKEGGRLALRFLKKNRDTGLSARTTGPRFERSILADDGGVLVFVEVKTRSGDAFGSPFEAVDRKKRDKIRKEWPYAI